MQFSLTAKYETHYNVEIWKNIRTRSSWPIKADLSKTKILSNYDMYPGAPVLTNLTSLLHLGLYLNWVIRHHRQGLLPSCGCVESMSRGMKLQFAQRHSIHYLKEERKVWQASQVAHLSVLKWGKACIYRSNRRADQQTAVPDEPKQPFSLAT